MTNSIENTGSENHNRELDTNWREYFSFSTDHKVIGVQYMVTTFIFFLIGGLLAMIILKNCLPLGKTCPRQAIAGFTPCVAHSYPRLVPKILGVVALLWLRANLGKIVDGSGCRTYAWITL